MEEKKRVVCHDCGKVLKKGDEYVCFTKEEENYLIKCKECYEKDPVMRDFQECDIYSRVVGFHTPTRRWNKGKAEEWKDRKTFVVEGEEEKDNGDDDKRENPSR